MVEAKIEKNLLFMHDWQKLIDGNYKSGKVSFSTSQQGGEVQR